MRPPLRVRRLTARAAEAPANVHAARCLNAQLYEAAALAELVAHALDAAVMHEESTPPPRRSPRPAVYIDDDSVVLDMNMYDKFMPTSQ